MEKCQFSEDRWRSGKILKKKCHEVGLLMKQALQEAYEDLGLVSRVQ
jgi:hypothetical protein